MLTKSGGEVKTEEIKVRKGSQEENMEELLTRFQPEDVIVFTDGSALRKPGPTGIGGAR